MLLYIFYWFFVCVVMIRSCCVLHVLKESDFKVFIKSSARTSKSINNTNECLVCVLHLLLAFAPRCISLCTFFLGSHSFPSHSISIPTPPLFPDDGALRIWKNFADQKNPEMVTAWQGLSDMLPTTRGQPSASTHSKDQRSILLSAPLYPPTHTPIVLPVVNHQLPHCISLPVTLPHLPI